MKTRIIVWKCPFFHLELSLVEKFYKKFACLLKITYIIIINITRKIL